MHEVISNDMKYNKFRSIIWFYKLVHLCIISILSTHKMLCLYTGNKTTSNLLQEKLVKLAHPPNSNVNVKSSDNGIKANPSYLFRSLPSAV